MAALLCDEVLSVKGKVTNLLIMASSKIDYVGYVWMMLHAIHGHMVLWLRHSRN